MRGSPCTTLSGWPETWDWIAQKPSVEPDSIGGLLPFLIGTCLVLFGCCLLEAGIVEYLIILKTPNCVNKIYLDQEWSQWQVDREEEGVRNTDAEMHRKNIESCRPFWSERSKTMFFCWFTSQKGRSTGCFLASLINIWLLSLYW